MLELEATLYKMRGLVLGPLTLKTGETTAKQMHPCYFHVLGEANHLPLSHLFYLRRTYLPRTLLEAQVSQWFCNHWWFKGYLLKHPV